MKCANCKWDFMQRNPTICPRCGSKDIVSEEQLIERFLKSEQYDEAASVYEELEMWEKAEECRKKANPHYDGSVSLQVGKVKSISMECPHCGKIQPLVSKSREIVCVHCKKRYAVSEKVFELLEK